MFKLCVLAILASSANAGVISNIGIGHGIAVAPVASGIGLSNIGLGHGIAVAAPVAHVAPVAVASHGAVSWQNSNSISVNPTPVIGRVAVAAPVVTKVAAPVAIAGPVISHAVAAPVRSISYGLGGWGNNGLGWSGNAVSLSGNGLGWSKGW